MVRPSPALKCLRLFERIGDPMLSYRDAACLINSIINYLKMYHSVGELRLVIDLVRLAGGGLLVGGFECLSGVVAKFGIGDLNLNDHGFSRFMRAIHRVLKVLEGFGIIHYTSCGAYCGTVSLMVRGVLFECPVDLVVK
jgi:hypothetical protein